MGGTPLRSGLVRRVDLSYRDWRDRADFDAREARVEVGGGWAMELGKYVSMGWLLSAGFAGQKLFGNGAWAAYPDSQLHVLVWPFAKLRWRALVGVKLWQYRTFGYYLRSDLVMLDYGSYFLAATVEAMATRNTIGFASHLVTGISF
jgi:hypothetical protein